MSVNPLGDARACGGVGCEGNSPIVFAVQLFTGPDNRQINVTLCLDCFTRYFTDQHYRADRIHCVSATWQADGGALGVAQSLPIAKG